MDTATTEYLFCRDFFNDDGVFRELFAPIIGVVEGEFNAAIQVTRRTLFGETDAMCLSMPRSAFMQTVEQSQLSCPSWQQVGNAPM